MLYIQDLSFSKSYSTHEALINSCSSSIQGYGAYSFATSSGVELLLNDKEFDAFLERGTYSMIVGVDEITNEHCLNTLNEKKESNPNFQIKAFHHTDPDSIFHPKVSFFKDENGDGSLIIGSGNLTIKGLRKNREAFGLIHLSEAEFSNMESYWKAWVAEAEANNNLKDLLDGDVIAKARENIFIPKSGKKKKDNTTKEKAETTTPEERKNAETVHSIVEGWCFTENSKVLLAEIPKSGDRWKQANFDVTTFKNFFGATPGDNNQRILLRSLNEDTSLSSIEVRPSVSVKSKNYRFELDAASGILYPVYGKPIGIFIQITTRMFLYHLFMPTHPLHEEISDWMNENWNGRTDRMKRIVTIATELNRILNKSVFKQYKT